MAPLSPLNGSRPVSRINSYSRTWSNSATESAQTASQEEAIYWPPSPVKQAPSKRMLTAHERRMAAIQEALSQPYDNDEPLMSFEPSVGNKRPMPFTDDTGPTKKRVLPWDKDHGQMKEEKRRQVAAQPTTNSGGPANTLLNNKPQKFLMSGEQRQILNLVVEGKSIFFTGSAGTGKSVLLREIIHHMRNVKYAKAQDTVAITASTGIAACNIGGVTLHSFAGIGLGKESAEELASQIRKNKKASARWLRTQVLIIDEVSMVDGDLFDKLATIGSIMKRRPGVPFGGIQLIVTGDFFQLPPVMKGGSPKFAFEANTWTQCIERTINLSKVFRQKDQEFVDMLNEMRFGRLSHKSIAKFKSLSRPIHYEDGIEPTELFPHRDDVERSNRARMANLNGEGRTYYAVDSGVSAQRDKLLSNLMAPTQLHLKVGSQVMLIKNSTDDSGLVNGSLGRVIAFVDPVDYKLGRYGPGLEIMEAAGDAKKKTGQQIAQGSNLLPLVQFVVPGSSHPKEQLVAQETWKVESNGEIQASRVQVPLILAWAMSIHKSQGQTLDRVKVDLGRAFEMGQAYVALSRATSLEGLQITRFEPSKVKAHPKVAKWSETLESLNVEP